LNHLSLSHALLYFAEILSAGALRVPGAGLVIKAENNSRGNRPQVAMQP